MATSVYADRQRQKVMERDARIHFLQGERLARQGDWDAALAAYSQSINVIPTSALCFFARAKCYFELQDYHRYIFDLSLAIHIEPENWVHYVARSHGFFKLGKIAEALKDLDYAVSQNSRSADLFFRRGVCYYELRRWRDAIDDFTACLALNEVHPSAYSRRGAAYLRLKDGHAAIGDLKKAVASASHASAHKNHYKLALAYLVIGAAALAVESFTSALDSAQQYKTELIAKARSRRNAQQLGISGVPVGSGGGGGSSSGLGGRPTGAGTNANAGAGAGAGGEPRRVFVVYEKRRYALIAFEDVDAFNIFDESESARASDSRPQSSLSTGSGAGAGAGAGGQAPRARTELQLLNECFPEYLASRGKAKALLGRHSEALADFSESIQLSSENPQTYYERANAFRIMGFYADALADIEFCARRKLNADIAFSKAIILENTGDLDGALWLYEAILAGHYSRPFAADYLAGFEAQADAQGRPRSAIDAVLDAVRDTLYGSPGAAAAAATAAVAASVEASTGVSAGAGDTGGDTAAASAAATAAAAATAPKHLHTPSLYHAAHLYRQRLNFARGIELCKCACTVDPLDDRVAELLAYLYFDSIDFEAALQAAGRCVELQARSATGVGWEVYYAQAMCLMRLHRYPEALEALVLAQNRPSGGVPEVAMRKGDADLLLEILAQLPPGTNVSVAYHMLKGISAIPRDPISPTSAARGYRLGVAPADQRLGSSLVGGAAVYPLLDLFGALPGCYNLCILLRKAECLYRLSDYIGCVRSCSLAVRQYDFRGHTARGVKLVTRIGHLITSHQRARSLDLGAVVASADSGLTPDETRSLLESVEQPLSRLDREYLYSVFFLRARALTILNRIERGVKDAYRALFVGALLGTPGAAEAPPLTQPLEQGAERTLFEASLLRRGAHGGAPAAAEGGGKARTPPGVGALLYFMSKQYAYLRLYGKAYHCARDAIFSGLPYYAVSRAHYMQGVSLVYTGRRRLAVRALSLALKTSFTARFASLIYERTGQTGLIQLPSLDQVAHFIELYPEYDPSNYDAFPPEEAGPPSLADSGPSGAADPGPDPGRGTAPARRPFSEFYALFDQGAQQARPGDIHRMPPQPNFPAAGTLHGKSGRDAQRVEQEFERRLSAAFDRKIERLATQVSASQLHDLAVRTAQSTRPHDRFFLVSNNLHSAQNDTLLSGPLRFATAYSWLVPDNVHMLHERAKVLQELGAHELACDDFTAVLRFQPRNARAFFRRAFSLKTLGFFEEAGLDFERARSLAPASEVYAVDYERLSGVGYIEVAPPGNEEHYAGEPAPAGACTGADPGASAAEPQGDALALSQLGALDFDCGATCCMRYDPEEARTGLASEINTYPFSYVDPAGVFEMVNVVTDSVRVARRVAQGPETGDDDLSSETD